MFSNKKTGYIIVIILLLITNGIFIYLYFSSHNKFNSCYRDQKNMQISLELKNELDSIIIEYNNIKEEYGSLNIRIN